MRPRVLTLRVELLIGFATIQSAPRLSSPNGLIGLCSRSENSVRTKTQRAALRFVLAKPQSNKSWDGLCSKIKSGSTRKAISIVRGTKPDYSSSTFCYTAGRVPPRACLFDRQNFFLSDRSVSRAIRSYWAMRCARHNRPLGA
jgi:hypothetical protein